MELPKSHPVCQCHSEEALGDLCDIMLVSKKCVESMKNIAYRRSIEVPYTHKSELTYCCLFRKG